MEVVAHCSLQRMDSPCESKSGLLSLPQCDGRAGTGEEVGEGKHFHHCLVTCTFISRLLQSQCFDC